MQYTGGSARLIPVYMREAQPPQGDDLVGVIDQIIVHSGNFARMFKEAAQQ